MQQEEKLFQDRYRRNLYAYERDHMRNGQLKPGYNVQIAVESEYIVGVFICLYLKK